MPRLFVTDRVESATRKSTAPRDISPEVVSAPQVPSLCSQYIIGLLGICLVFVPMLEALGTYINLGSPLRIGGIFAVALAVAAVVQINEWVMYAQVALGLGLFGLGCFGPTDAIVDILFCCIFGLLITFLAAMQAGNFKPTPACEELRCGRDRSGGGFPNARYEPASIMRRLSLNRSEPAAKKSGQNIPKNRCRTTIAERMVETLAELPFIGDQSSA